MERFDKIQSLISKSKQKNQKSAITESLLNHAQSMSNTDNYFPRMVEE